jgi:hypothetical protein
MADELEEALRAAQAPGPDAAARIACPACGKVLAEYLVGVARFTCYRCRWQGLIIRTGAAAALEVRTLQPGTPSRWRDEHKEG